MKRVLLIAALVLTGCKEGSVVTLVDSAEDPTP